MLLADEDVGDGALVGDLFEGVLDGCSIICIPNPSVRTSTLSLCHTTGVIKQIRDGLRTNLIELDDV